MAFPMVPPTAEEERRLELIQYIEWAFHDFNGANFFTPEEADGQQTRQRFSMRRRVVHRLPPVQLDPFEEGENDDWASADEQEEAGTSRSSNGSGSISSGDGNNSLDGSPPTGPELLGTTSQRLVDFRLRALAQVYELLVTNRHATKRDLFYESKSLYQTQANFDRALSAVCKFLDASRSELHVISCSKGFAVGDLRLYNAMDEAEVDFGGGMPVPITEQLTKFDFAHSEAKFLLVVEKDSVFQRLLDERWAERFPNSILVTGRGYPDICTRLFLSWLALKFPSMPMLALVDADPYGIEIFLTYKFGSERSRVETGHVDLHRLQWIGFLPSETEQLAFPADQVLPLVPSDRRKIEKLGGRLLAHGEQAIYDELAILLRNSWKLEIEALCSLGPQFLTAVYLNHKLEQYTL